MDRSSQSSTTSQWWDRNKPRLFKFFIALIVSVIGGSSIENLYYHNRPARPSAPIDFLIGPYRSTRCEVPALSFRASDNLWVKVCDQGLIFETSEGILPLRHEDWEALRYRASAIDQTLTRIYKERRKLVPKDVSDHRGSPTVPETTPGPTHAAKAG